MVQTFTKYVTSMTDDDVLNASSWFDSKSREAVSQQREVAFDSKKLDAGRVIKENSIDAVSRVRLGHLYLFRYEPKLRETLPYYDTFPIIFIIDRARDGFLGLNMHYLPYEYRARLMDALYEFVTGEEDLQRLRVTYRILSSTAKLRYYKPCLKYYLNNHIKSRFLHVSPDEWNTAVFLPLHRFRKATIEQVHRDSVRMIRKSNIRGNRKV